MPEDPKETFKNAVLTAKMTEMKDTIVEKCVLLCEKYSLKYDEFLGKIEAFLINNSLEVLDLEPFGKFEQEIHRESSKVTKVRVTSKLRVRI